MELPKLLKQFSNSNKRHYIELAKLQKIKKEMFDISELQKGFSNFYHPDSIQPWSPISAYGPWILTNHNKIVYDAGGYGMLSFGHNPIELKNSISKDQVMANIMTPSKSQSKFWNLLKKEIPYYESIVCLNSGSEANSFAMRIANIHRHPKPVKVTMKGSFHGRTDNPAKVSNSCLQGYKKHLQRFNDKLPVYSIKMNDIKEAEKTFKKIKENGEFPEITLIEPVQGEGNPGVAMSPEFYKVLRKLTKEACGLLLSDSIQAGWRCCGELSIMNYPGFSELEPPDMETYSKSINAGQYPLSVLALSKNLTDNFRPGLYGNTMTSNPRALDIGSDVLKNMDQSIRENIRIKGNTFLNKLNELVTKYDFITHSTGKGLLLALHIDKSIPVLKIERKLRESGLNVIHGGENALRFTPWFYISDEEIDYIIEKLVQCFDEI